MRNITDILARYLSDINLPSVSIIDIIEIILITFFCISVHGVDQILHAHILCYEDFWSLAHFLLLLIYLR